MNGNDMVEFDEKICSNCEDSDICNRECIEDCFMEYLAENN